MPGQKHHRQGTTALTQRLVNRLAVQHRHPHVQQHNTDLIQIGLRKEPFPLFPAHRLIAQALQ